MAIGILGGTFNPVHIGHLRGVIEVREQLHLTEVRLLPAAEPPLKETPTVSAAHRAAMLDVATADMSGVEVDRRELNRSGPSYTVDTLAELRAELGPDYPLVFIVGADSLTTLHRWHAWERVFDLANLAVMARPNNADTHIDASVVDFIAPRTVACDDLLSQPLGALCYLAQPPLSVSSTSIREALVAGKNVQFLLPPAVIEYINQHDLYLPS